MARTISRFDLVVTMPVGLLDELRQVLDAAWAAPSVISVGHVAAREHRLERY